MSSHGHNGEEQFPVDIKKTKQREEIFRILTSALEPVSAVDIYSCLLKTMPDAGFAISTVYRSLAVFEEKGYHGVFTVSTDCKGVFICMERCKRKHM